MSETEVECNFMQLADLCDQYISPRRFYLHNRIGGIDWEVVPNYPAHRRTTIKLADPAKLTFILLKIK
jgi:hypothetical protein